MLTLLCAIMMISCGTVRYGGRGGGKFNRVEVDRPLSSCRWRSIHKSRTPPPPPATDGTPPPPHDLTVFLLSFLVGQVALCSSHYALLAPAAEGLLSLLFPFVWQGAYIPVMPFNMKDVLEVRAFSW